MNDRELAICFSALRGYWPNLEWSRDTITVWSEVLLELDALALPAIRAMAAAERFPSIAALLEHARTTRGTEVDRGDGRRWRHIAGTGFVELLAHDDPAHRAELDTTPADRAAAVVSIRNARTALRRTQ